MYNEWCLINISQQGYNMSIAIQIHSQQFSDVEISDVLKSAIGNETEQARLRRDYYAGICARFEEEYGINSEEFMVQFESGSLGDDEAFFDWFAAKRAFDVWDRRYKILSEVAV